jgi:hypothetical protein
VIGATIAPCLHQQHSQFEIVRADADGNVVRPKPRIIASPYTISLEGQLPFPDGTPAGTEIDLPFTGLTVAATLLIIENQTGQELGMAWGGNFSPNFPNKGTIIWAFPAAPATRPILSLRFWTTVPQVGLGMVPYTVLGS